MSKGTIFFDYDGTLHDSMKLYSPALRKAYAWLVDQGIVEPQELRDEEICRWLGWQVEDMWTTFVPGIDEATWRTAAKMVADDMNKGLHAGKGALFPGVKEMLEELYVQGFELAFLSNAADPIATVTCAFLASITCSLPPIVLRNSASSRNGRSISRWRPSMHTHR